MHSSSPNHHLHAFDANSKGRDFIVGDIHGCFDLLENLLAELHFCSNHDRVFCTGDLIDRGPCSEQVVRWLSYPWFHAVRGNHEQMVLDHVAGQGDAARHARNGGAWFYSLPEAHQQQIAEALLSMPLAIEVALQNGRKIGIIHAESPCWEDRLGWPDAIALLYSEEPATQLAARQQAMYSRGKITRQDPTPIAGIETLYVGHSTVPQILQLGNVVYLDTGCSFPDGRLSAIELPRTSTNLAAHQLP
ncbi:metallophosphoesterase [Pseudomonas sp.]|uniref:metallophosphoesterase n=1 Tax=Pseudomonas sp. TaxID=306 RepID=UPI003D700E4C